MASHSSKGVNWPSPEQELLLRAILLRSVGIPEERIAALAEA